MRFTVFLTLSAMSLITARASAAAPDDAPFSPARFFLGQTEGRGTLTKIMSGPTAVTVSGHGRMDARTLILDQSVIQPGAAPLRRQWRLVETAPGHYSGTLSDAVGPVTGVVAGNDFHVFYRAKGAVSVDQHLVLQPGGRVILNQMVFRKFGMRVARLSETIRKTA